jgi:histidinol-phosphatase (PHP family)
MKIDGHIHTPFCPHGSTDTFEQYIEKAIAENFDVITFTEHAPLPASFIDPTPMQDSGMAIHVMDAYFEKLNFLKKQYADQITIRIGLEVDYIKGYEAETTALLNTYGPLLDDSILSVHFLQHNDAYTCIDYSKEVYLDFAQAVGSIQTMYEMYYATVLASIEADLGPYKPKRIGHPTLIHKFQLAHTEQIDDQQTIEHLLLAIKHKGYELDFNSAGLNKPFCNETYPPITYKPFIQKYEIPYTFGSDAHIVVDLHKHYDIVNK